MIRNLLGFVVALLIGGCTPAVSPSPVDASDAAPVPTGTLHTYTCSVVDGGPSWACQDGVTQPVGTCELYGCKP
jgi:hypothetical protein